MLTGNATFPHGEVSPRSSVTSLLQLMSAMAWPHLTACRPVLGRPQTAHWMGTQPHPSADRLPEDPRIPRPPPEGQDPAPTNQRSGTALPLPTSRLWPLDQPRPPGGRHRMHKSHNPVACRPSPSTAGQPCPGASGVPVLPSGQHKLWDTPDPGLNCVRRQPSRPTATQHQLWDPALPAHSLAQTRGPGFTHQ